MSISPGVDLVVALPRMLESTRELDMTSNQIDPSVGTDLLAIGYAARPSTGSKRHLLGWLLRGLAVFALLAPVSMIAVSPVAAAPLAADGACATGLANVGGQGIICDVTIVNTITAIGGSATVTVYECQGSAGDPKDGAKAGHPCTTTTTTANTPVTAISQCDGSASGGGGKLLCTVIVTNNFVGVSPGATAVTVNQCIGSGASITPICNPLGATTSAAITQCNKSANGGGASLTCTATGTMASALVVTIDQCNGSANGGGAFVKCSATMTNNVVPAASPSGSPASSITPAPGITAAPTSTLGDGPSNNSAPLFPLMILLALSGLVLATVVTQRRRLHS
jgi:hypothetical protein